MRLCTYLQCSMPSQLLYFPAMYKNMYVASANMMNNVFPECSYFVPNHSDVRNQRLYFTYNVKITNNSSNTMQLLNRHWTITNAHGAKQEIRYIIQLCPVVTSQWHTQSSLMHSRLGRTTDSSPVLLVCILSAGSSFERTTFGSVLPLL